MKVKMATSANHPKEHPWLMRTYSGYASAKESNLLYRANLAKGQTGLSIAFDLPTQMAYDSDDILAKGEVGKLGVPPVIIAPRKVVSSLTKIMLIASKSQIKQTRAPIAMAIGSLYCDRPETGSGCFQIEGDHSK